jgi:hypothetical protein
MSASKSNKDKKEESGKMGLNGKYWNRIALKVSLRYSAFVSIKIYLFYLF